MRAVVQRVNEASVKVAEETVGSIGMGLLVLLGVEQGDTSGDVEYLAEKTIGLRIFEDDQGRMNRSLIDMGGSLLVVSQFTLLGDVRKGKRPSFIQAAEPQTGERLYEEFVESCRRQEVNVQTGRFRAMMNVYLVNQGPVTILLDSRKKF